MGGKTIKAKGWKKWVAGTAVAAAVGAGAFGVSRLPYFVGETVTEVIDGDSFKIANKQTIRLASLDAPEDEFCMGAEATKALTKKILGKRVILRDVKTDIYRRILALVYVNGELVNEYMIRGGFAVTTREAIDENENVSAANTNARENHLGVYSTECFQKDPPNPKCPIKGNIDDRNKKKEYLTPDCRAYNRVIVEKSFGEEWFCTENQAKKAGYTKSSGCNTW